MRKTLLSVLTLMCFFLPSMGQEVAESLTIGYVNGENGSMGDITSSNAKTLSAAINIPSGMVESLVGNRLETVRVYLPSKLNITSLTVWVRSDLDGENLTETTIKTKEIQKGWNDIALEAPFEIKDSTPFYLGYTFEQKSRAYAITCAGFYVDGGLYFRYDDGQWETDSKFGNLCLEGIVKGDNLPLYDLELNYVSVPPIYYTGESLALKARVTNHAAATIKGFTLSYSIPEMVEGSKHFECDLTAGQMTDLEFEIPALNLPDDEEFELTFAISALDEGVDQAPANNTKTAILNTSNNIFKKVVLVEEFTTEKCGNCPGAAPKVHAAVDKFNEEHPGSVVMLCHHAGYFTDFLTHKFDQTLLYLYGQSTYAPAAMADRFGDGFTPVFGISDSDGVYKKIAAAYEQPVNYALVLDATYDEDTKTLNVNVNGSRTVEETGNPTRISVVAVENDVPSRNQSGADSSYIHQHVMRAANSAWGDVIDWNGYDFEYSCSFPIDDAWVKKNMQVIAYINQYDDQDNGNCKVENTRFMDFPFSGDDTSVESIFNAEADARISINAGMVEVAAPYTVDGIWTPSGVRVANGNLASGLFLVKVSSANHTITKKVNVK